MPITVLHGRTAKLTGQLETTFRTPPVSPAMQILKFNKFTIGQVAELQDDPTINQQTLMDKRDDMDSSADASGEHILCLNDIGFWLTLLMGPPVTTGAGPYTHVFTFDLNDRPSAILEFDISNGANTKFGRFLGMMLNEMSWTSMDAAMNFTTGGIGAIEVKPFPTVAFDSDAAPRYPKSRACKKATNIYDVFGSSTLGVITKHSTTFTNDLSGESAADGQEGFATVLLGQPTVNGSSEVLWTVEPSIIDAAFTGASKKIVEKISNAAGTHSMTTTLPNVEFDRPKRTVETSKGLKQSLNWRAHNVDGADPVTISLVNAVEAY